VKAIEYYERFLRSDTDPKLRTEAEKSLRSLRLEPEPAGKADRGSRTALWIGLGGGAALVATGVVILAVVLGGSAPDGALPGMGGAF
jgi:hypothetical protein